MRILIVGATGFIGSHLVAGLGREGHHIVCAGRDENLLKRKFPQNEIVPCDLAIDTIASWKMRLAGIDAVINAAGILRGDFQAVQGDGPIRLFEACAAAGIRHVIQISGLGAARETPAAFLNTKVPADERLRDLAGNRQDISWVVLRPGVVIGAGGQATAMFLALAACPWPIGIGDGQSRLAVVAVEDIVSTITQLLQRPARGFAAYDVATDLITTDDLTLRFRTWLGLRPRRMLRVPYGVLSLFAKWGYRLGLGSLTPETLAMLRAGLVADMHPLETELERPIGSLQAALTRRCATRDDLHAARRIWQRPLLAMCVLLCVLGIGFLRIKS